MLVDVIRLRVKGVRRPDAELRALRPLRGMLWITDFRPAVDSATTPLMAALLRDGASVLPPLDWAVVKLIRNGQMIVAGYEDESLSAKRSQPYRQSWWCKVVTAGTAEPAAFEPSPDLSDAHPRDQRGRWTVA